MKDYGVNYDVNRQGVVTLNGKTMPTQVDAFSFVDEASTVDDDVREINQETEELRSLGLLAPFVEGTPIGKCQNKRRPRKPTRKEVLADRWRWKQFAREALFRLRAQNDRMLKEILNDLR